MNTITSIAHDHNLDRKTVEYAVSKAKRDHGELGELKEENRIKTRFFNQEETDIIMQYLPQSTRGSQSVVETSIVTIGHEFQALEKHNVSGRVGRVAALDIDLNLIQTTVLALVSKAEQEIDQDVQENLELLKETQQTKDLLNQQLERLQRKQQNAEMQKFVVETLAGNNKAEIKDLLGKLQNSL
jgi:hypothetical protein